jgi:L-lactate dehydrogenase (cytochrome)
MCLTLKQNGQQSRVILCILMKHRPHGSHRSARMKRFLTIDELQVEASQKIPKMFYDYVTSGSWTQSTLLANHTDFQQIKFKQKVCRDISNRNLKTTLIGHNVTMPVVLGPAGFTGMVRGNGEILAAKAAAEYGIPFILSTMSICSIEDLQKEFSKSSSIPFSFWFQLYVMKNKAFVKKLIDRAIAANCSALMVTVDLQVLGQRHLDIKNGLSAPPKITLSNLLNLSTKPRWCYEMLHATSHNFGNIVGHVDGVSDLTSLSSWISDQFDPSLTWDDVMRIRELWGSDRKFIVKGIMDGEDARELVRRCGGLSGGIDAIVVSNHGGRQLDSTVSSISVLEEVIASVQDELVKNGREKDEIEIWLDSGIRSGQDILKALALGAKGTLIGKAYLYGLGAGGQEGVTRTLEILNQELDVTMGFCGVNDIRKVDREILKVNPFAFLSS